MLTTITAYWKRPDVLAPWLEGVLGSTIKHIHHAVYFIGEDPPSWWWTRTAGTNVYTELLNEVPGVTSIGKVHNLGARIAMTEWIMKMDVDTVPNVDFFNALKSVLLDAGPREWFNVGMFMLNQTHTESLREIPVPQAAWREMLGHLPDALVPGWSNGPVGTNFVCRRQSYLDLGGCDPHFHGWGWEDYQQIFMLEAYERGSYPLDGPINLTNVTNLCRDLSRVKAMQTYQTNCALALAHRWHPRNINNASTSNANRLALFNYINRWRPSLTKTSS